MPLTFAVLQSKPVEMALMAGEESHADDGSALGFVSSEFNEVDKTALRLCQPDCEDAEARRHSHGLCRVELDAPVRMTPKAQLWPAGRVPYRIGDDIGKRYAKIALLHHASTSCTHVLYMGFIYHYDFSRR